MVSVVLGILNTCVLVLCVVSEVWSVRVRGYLYGFNLWSIPGFIIWVWWLFLIFLWLFSSYCLWTWSVLRRVY